MKKMICRKKKAAVVGTGAFVFLIMCFSLVQNASIRHKAQKDTNSEGVVIGANEINVLDPDKKDVKNSETGVQGKLVLPEINAAAKLSPSKKPSRGKSIEAPGSRKGYHDINIEHVEDKPEMKEGKFEALNENEEDSFQKDIRDLPLDENKLGVADAGILDLGDEDGAGETILRVDPLGDKPLPLVKASNKIDAILEARPNADRVKEKLNLDDLQPPDHLDAVRMEQDGHLNKDYKKEIFLGNHEELDEMDEEEMEKKLKEIFILVDHNGNNFITVDELEDWIIQKVQEHFQEAADENKLVFNSVDTNKDGAITWLEFQTQFLMALGMSPDSAEEHANDIDLNEDVDYRDTLRKDDAKLPLESEDREHLLHYRYKWNEADKDPQDDKLSLQEFQSFRHPEQSQSMLLNMVEDIIDNLDKDNDGIVSESEFVMLSLDDEDPDLTGTEKQWLSERQKEFRTVIDTDHDRKLTKDELLNYVDPQNPNHAKLEARNLLALGDTNRDERLSLEEVLDNMDLFIGSKMVDTGRSFHDEF